MAAVPTDRHEHKKLCLVVLSDRGQDQPRGTDESRESVNDPRETAFGARPAGRCGAPDRVEADQRVDLLTDPRTRAMQQDALVLRADVQQRTRCLGVAPFHVAQQDHRALAGWQKIDRFLNVIPELSSHDNSLRVQLVPQPGHLNPMSVWFEFRERDAAFGGRCSFHQRAQSNEASLAGDASAGTVDDDAEDPGYQARASLEATHAGIYRQPGILHDFLGLGVAADYGSSKTHERRMKAADQNPIRGRVPLAQTREKSRIVEIGWIHWADLCPPAASRWRCMTRPLRAGWNRPAREQPMRDRTVASFGGSQQLPGRDRPLSWSAQAMAVCVKAFRAMVSRARTCVNWSAVLFVIWHGLTPGGHHNVVQVEMSHSC
jgi:hypothetical protein